MVSDVWITIKSKSNSEKKQKQLDEIIKLSRLAVPTGFEPAEEWNGLLDHLPFVWAQVARHSNS